MVVIGANMLISTKMLLEKYRDYANPDSKISRDVIDGKYIRLKRGTYETDPNTQGYLVSGFYNPSYLSFEYALFRHGIIPEKVYEYTSATTMKHRTKRFDTPLGIFSYRDVPVSVFRFGIKNITEGGYSYWLAEPVKAVCDQLYSLPPVSNLKEIEHLVFDNQRMDYTIIESLELDEVLFLENRYHSKNVTLFSKLLKRLKK